DRYINLFTDYGFKKLFGEEPNKDLLIAFLNDLLRKDVKIEELTYLKNERLGREERERRAVYDLYCTNEKGEKFIIEIQRVKQEFFKDRSVFYSSFAIQDQARKGKDWKYEMKGVYTIAMLDFEFDDTDKNEFEHYVQLVNTRTNKVFYDKLTYVYFEIPKFNKPLSDLKTNYDRWLFAFKNLHKLDQMPKELEQGIFKKLFDLAEIARMDFTERSVYEDSLKDYRDLKSALETSFKEGKEEGEFNKAIKVAKNAIQEGFDNKVIKKLTGLAFEHIEELRNNKE
ncbi:MAG: Rpn family recombination-promoting nuclease/putative transposase, partial [Bacteroidota bacterium]